jgi:cytochrome o ubiquinol oxidase subunit IV
VRFGGRAGEIQPLLVFGAYELKLDHARKLGADPRGLASEKMTGSMKPVNF